MNGDILNAGDNVDGQEMFGFSKLFFKIAPRNIDEYTKSKLLNLQQENVRPQRNIDTNDIIPDEKYQNNKIDDKKYDVRYQIGKIDREKIIEDKEIVQLQNLSTEIEKINRKEFDDLE